MSTVLVDANVLLDILIPDPEWEDWSGKAFLSYRKKSGTRRSTLPDFFIGAHAAVRDYTLLTRDARRFRTYFPTLEVMAPEP